MDFNPFNGVELPFGHDDKEDKKASTETTPLTDASQTTSPDEAATAKVDAPPGKGCTVLVCVMRGKALIPMDKASPTNGFTQGSEPFVKVSLGSESCKTAYVRSLDPVWKETVTFRLSTPEEVQRAELDIGVFDQDFDFSEPETMGGVKVPLGPILASGRAERRWYRLTGKVDSAVRGKKADAEGEIELLIDVARDDRPPPKKPVPPSVKAMAAMVVPGLLWVVALFYAVLAQLRAALLEGVAFYVIWLSLWLVFGMHVKIRRVSVRFGFLVEGPTEFILSGIEIRNPPGAYVADEALLRLDHFVIHISMKSVFNAIYRKRCDPFKFPTIDIPLIHVRGLKLVTEKAAGSPHARPGEQMLNLYALLGGKPAKPPSPQSPPPRDDAANAEEDNAKAEKGAAGAEETKASDASSGFMGFVSIGDPDKKSKKGKKGGKDADGEDGDEDNPGSAQGTLTRPRKWEDLTPDEQRKFKSRSKRCLGVPYLWRINAILLHDIELFLADAIADSMGNEEGIRSSNSAYIEKIILVKSDLNGTKPLIGRRLVKKVIKKTNLLGLMMEIAGQVAVATGGKISPAGVHSTLNAATGGLFDDSTD